MLWWGVEGLCVNCRDYCVLSYHGQLINMAPKRLLDERLYSYADAIVWDLFDMLMQHKFESAVCIGLSFHYL